MKRFVVIPIVVACVIALMRFAHLETLASAFLNLPSDVLISLVFLLAAAELAKGLRWAFFLRASELDIRTIDALTSYLAAQSATALPGGGVLPVRLAKEHGRVQMHQAAAGLVGQSLSDYMALAGASAVAIVVTKAQLGQLAVPVLMMVATGIVIAVFRSRWVARLVMRLLCRFRLTRRFANLEDDFRYHTRLLMNPRTLAIGAAFSVLTTMIATAVLLTLVNALTDRGITTSEAIYVHAFSAITGSMLPVSGLFGVSDASQAGLLNYIGIGLARATFLAVSYKTVGILFRTVLGSVVLLARYPHVLIGHVGLPLPERLRRRVAARLPVHIPAPLQPAVPSSGPQPAPVLVEPLAAAQVIDGAVD